ENSVNVNTITKQCVGQRIIDVHNNSNPVKDTTLNCTRKITPYIDVKSEVYEFRKEQREDVSLKHIFEQINDVNSNTDYFVLDSDGLLYRKAVINDCEIRQLIAPEPRRLQILELAHNSSWGGTFNLIKPTIELNSLFIGPEFDKM